MQAATCPNREDLVAFALGRLPEDTVTQIADHLDGCPRCESTVASLDNLSDSFLSELRHPVSRGEFLEGINLSELVRSGGGPLSVPDACEVIRQAAVGLEHAHQHGLVHRDVKPSNLMLTPDGTVKILDLGLARCQLDPSANEEMAPPGELQETVVGEITATGQAVGTADYMAPEQVSNVRAVDIRADVYGLGCTLYTLLTGHAPFSGPEYQSTSAKMAAHVKTAVPPIRQFRREVPSGLVTVLNRTLAKNPADRFATPAEVAEAMIPFTAGCDLNSLLTEAEGIASSPDKTDESIGDSGARHRSAPVDPRLGRRLPPYWKWLTGAAGGGLILLLGVVLFVHTGHGTIKIEIADRDVEVFVDEDKVTIEGLGQPIELSVGRHELVVERDGLVVHTQRFQVKRGKNDALAVTLEPFESPGESKTTVSVDTERETETDQGLASAPSVEENQAPPGWPIKIGKPIVRPTPVSIEIAPEPLPWKQGDPLSALALVTNPAPIPGVLSWTVETVGHRTPAMSIDFKPDGKLLATISREGTIRLWEVRTGELRAALVGGREGRGLYGPGLGWSPGGSYIVSADDVGLLRFWEAETGRLVRQRKAAGEVETLAWSPDGQLIVTGGRGAHETQIWDVSSGTILAATECEEKVSSLAWSPDGNSFASGGAKGTIKLYDAQSGQRQRTFDSEGRVGGLAWSADGNLLASSASGSFPHSPPDKFAVQVWDAKTGKRLCSLAEPPSSGYGYRALAWSPDGRTLAEGGQWCSTRLWNMEAGNPVLTLPRTLRGYACCLSYSPEGRTVAIGDGNGTVRLQDTESISASRLLPGYETCDMKAAVSPDSSALAYVTNDGDVRVWRIGTHEEPRRLGPTTGFRESLVFGVAWSSDGKLLGVMSDSLVQIWDVATGDQIVDLQEPIGRGWIDFSPVSRIVATRDYVHPAVRIWDITAGTLLRELESPGYGLAWSPDGDAIAVGAEQKVVVFSLHDGSVLQTLSGFPDEVNKVAWSPDGKALAAGGKHVCIWDVESGRVLHTMHHSLHYDDMYYGDLCWLEDGKVLVHATFYGVTVWDTDSGKLLRKMPMEFSHYSFVSPNGRFVAHQYGGQIQLRSLESGEVFCTFLALPGGQYAVFSPEGHYYASPGVEKDLVYVVQTEKGQETLSPEEFNEKYGWKNDPEKVRLADDHRSSTPKTSNYTATGRE